MNAKASPCNRCKKSRFRRCDASSLRRDRLRRRVTRGQQTTSETIEWEKEHAIEVDVLKSHRCNVTECPAVNHFPEFGVPSVERGLHSAGIPAHHNIGHKRKRT
jgi:hypothetical protein